MTQYNVLVYLHLFKTQKLWKTETVLWSGVQYFKLPLIVLRKLLRWHFYTLKLRYDRWLTKVVFFFLYVSKFNHKNIRLEQFHICVLVNSYVIASRGQSILFRWLSQVVLMLGTAGCSWSELELCWPKLVLWRSHPLSPMVGRDWRSMLGRPSTPQHIYTEICIEKKRFN